MLKSIFGLVSGKKGRTPKRSVSIRKAKRRIVKSSKTCDFC